MDEVLVRGHARGIVLGLALLLTAACESRETFVLLLDSGHTAGSISVKGAGTSRMVSEPLKAVDVGEAGTEPSQPFQISTTSVANLFSEALGQQPLPPNVYILHFESGTTTLTADSLSGIGEVVLAILDRNSPDVSIVGHADRTGDPEMNLALSLRRAEAVRDLIVVMGVEPGIIEVDSHGENNPLVPTADNVAEPRNRRVEVTVR